MKIFWQNVEREAAAKQMNVQDLAAAAGTEPGAPVSVGQVAAIRDSLNNNLTIDYLLTQKYRGAQ